MERTQSLETIKEILNSSALPIEIDVGERKLICLPALNRKNEEVVSRLLVVIDPSDQFQSRYFNNADEILEHGNWMDTVVSVNITRDPSKLKLVYEF